MVCSGVCAFGMYMNVATVFSGFIWTVISIIAMACMMSGVMNRSNPETKRMGYLWALSFFMGFLVGPVMHHLAEFQPDILIQAIGYTSVMFGSFTAISLFSKRRSWLFLGGIISSIISCMFWYRTICWLFGYSRYGHDEVTMVYLLVGLFTACLYVIYDT